MRLTSLLRGVLRSEGEFTTLGRELELVEAYLDIERARFEERLRVRIDVPPALRRIRVPPLVLQPLVENAVKHGIAPERRGGEVIVTARLRRPAPGSDPQLTLVVDDTGAGASAAALRRGRERRRPEQRRAAAGVPVRRSRGPDAPQRARPRHDRRDPAAGGPRRRV